MGRAALRSRLLGGALAFLSFCVLGGCMASGVILPDGGTVDLVLDATPDAPPGDTPLPDFAPLDVVDVRAEPDPDLGSPDLAPMADLSVDRGPAPGLAALEGPGFVIAGQRGRYTLTLASAARWGGERVEIASSDPDVLVIEPGGAARLEVAVAEGATTASFEVTALAGAIGQSATLTATLEEATAGPLDVSVSAPAGTVIITEILPIAAAGQDELVELLNTGPVALDIARFTLASQSSGPQPIAAAGGGALMLAPGARLVLARTGASTGVPAQGFWGPAPSGFALADGGDRLELVDEAGTVQDVVDFRSLVTDPRAVVGPASFPGAAGVSMQLDPAHERAADNDDGSSWCLSFRARHSAGAPNGACQGQVVINEVLVDAAGADERNVFFELAGPGGAPVGGLEVYGVHPDTGARLSSTVVTPGARMPVDGLWVIADSQSGSTLVPNADQTDTELQATVNTAGGVQLVAGGVLLDAFGFGAITRNPPTSVEGGLPFVEGTPAPAAGEGLSYSRNASSTDTGNNAADFTAGTPTPGTR